MKKIYISMIVILLSIINIRNAISQTFPVNSDSLPSWSLIRCAVVYADSAKVQLSKKRIKKLFACWKELEQQILEHNGQKFQARKAEYMLVSPLFTTNEIECLLAAKYKEDAWADAKRGMGELRRYHLVNDSNAVSIQNEVATYYLKQKIAREWVNIEATRKRLFALCDVKDYMPTILKILNKKRKEDEIIRKKRRF